MSGNSNRPPALESEDQVRHLKASESVASAFQAMGMTSPPADLAAILTSFVSSSTKSIPFREIANMAPGSGQLGASALAGVNLLIGSMTSMQRDAMKAGVNQLDRAQMLKLNEGLARIGVSAKGGLAGGNSSRFDRLDSSSANGDWTSPAGQAQMRDLAIQKGIPWAANNRELLQLGPAAIESIAQANLNRETYSRLTNDASFSAKNVVTITDYANRTGTDANKIGNAIADANDGLTPEEKKRHNGALLKFMDARKPEEQQAAKANLQEVQKTLEGTHPEKSEKFKKLDKQLEEKKAQVRAENSATQSKEAKVSPEDAKADSKGAKQAATKSQLLATLD